MFFILREIVEANYDWVSTFKLCIFPIILLLTNHEGKNRIIACPKEIILAQAAKPRGQELVPEGRQ